ncbi:thioredoxin family protein [Flavobacterium sp. HBTb2-11-1]|uniref:thioredoxin family protein n=1 Tax=Flavobacterium sp. HBTb2-11-1 TaxID=2692212 RepID=UPI001369CBF3|nr:thioredoxin family protein [Flavobacterium sp. HBTb2-11-1]MXO06074.1 thioredoxin fold domain-containing protein [Flavobacterium sp. HBTb2-11-1]
MRNFLLIILLVFTSNSIKATWLTSFTEAQQEALATNKLIIVDFTARWCGPCREMDLTSWNDTQVQNVIQNYVQLKIDVDRNNDFALKYQIRELPSMMVIDANGKVLHRFSGYQTPAKLKIELIQFSLSTEYLSTELSNYYTSKKYTTAIRAAQKYYTYSLLVDKNIKGKIIQVGSDYLKEAKDELKKNEEDYNEKKQKLELISLYELAYHFDFDKLNKKISKINPEFIAQSNTYQYWFLKYLSVKSNLEDAAIVEQFLRENDLENVIENCNQLYAFYEKSK